MKGKVESVVQKVSKSGKIFYTIIVDGIQYSTFVRFQPGETVEFDVEESSGYKNMRNPHIVYSENDYIAKLQRDSDLLAKIRALLEKKLGEFLP